ncbi:MAG: hypothetical protein ACREEM_39405 [Blastocatellia bacterium]
MAGAALHTNASQSAQGRFGTALVLPPGWTLTPGTRQLVIVTFTATATKRLIGLDSARLGLI